MARVSINLCCYNSAPFLERTLQSIVAQTYKDWELVVVNDGSTDATGAIIQRYRSEGYPIIYHEQRNTGVSGAHNQAFRLSSGEYLAFIDHDDVWAPRKLERQLPLFDEKPEVGLVFSDCINVLDGGYVFRRYEKCRPYAGEAFRRLLRQYFLTTSTILIRRAVIADTGERFDPHFKVVPDAEFFLRVAFRWQLAFVNEPLARTYLHTGSASYVGRDRIAAELRAILAKQRSLHPHFDREFAREIQDFELGLARGEARRAWAADRRKEAMDLLRPYSLATARDFWMIRCLSYPGYERLRRVWSKVRQAEWARGEPSR